MTPLLAQIQLNIQFINPWAVNSNTRGDELDLVTPFARGIPAVDVITPTPHGISMPSGGSRLKRGSLLLRSKMVEFFFGPKWFFGHFSTIFGHFDPQNPF